jgi:hypothetical protein
MYAVPLDVNSGQGAVFAVSRLGFAPHRVPGQIARHVARSLQSFPAAGIPRGREMAIA